MKTSLALFVFALVACCASGADVTPRYLDKAGLEVVIGKLQSSQYPMTRAETVASLGLGDRNLPSLRETSGDDDREMIRLTDPEKKGRSYRLFLWYDRSARGLGGDSFIRAKIINYFEMVVEDDGTGDAPKAVYILQSFRYPYVKLEHPGAPSATTDPKWANRVAGSD